MRCSIPLFVDYCFFQWDSTGKYAFINFPAISQGTFSVPAMRGEGSETPSGGFARIEDIPSRNTYPRSRGLWTPQSTLSSTPIAVKIPGAISTGFHCNKSSG